MSDTSRTKRQENGTSRPGSLARSMPRSIPFSMRRPNALGPRLDAANGVTSPDATGVFIPSLSPPKAGNSLNVSALSSLITTAPLEAKADVSQADAAIQEKMARRVSEHLVKPFELGVSFKSPEVDSVSYNLLGGDVTREIYSWDEKRRTNLISKRRMSDTEISAVSQTNENATMASDLRHPGMFRRHFIKERKGSALPSYITNNFLDFLAIYGTYGGDVCPSEYESDDSDGLLQDGDEEEQPLLVRSNKTSIAPIKGVASKKAFFMLMKGFVGTGVLFLPKAYTQGGLLFCSVIMIIVGWLTYHCMMLLVETSREIGGSFGDIGEKLYGPKVRFLVLASIAIAQLGFCCAYYIFCAQNFRDLLMIASDCQWVLPEWVFMFVQFLVYFPLSWIRKIKHFSFTALVADVFIVMGLGYVFYYNLLEMSVSGIARDVVMFNPKAFSLFIGTAIFAFEGIGLILPIADSMEKPEKFGPTLFTCIAVIGVVFVAVGASGYLTFGNKVETIIFLNLPKESPVVLIIQFLYAIAILLSFPLTVYPAIHITEQGIFGQLTGKLSRAIKWQKNLYRTGLVLFLAGVSYWGSDNLDKFVSLVGCFACIPLSFIYPSVFHYCIAKNRWTRLKDLILALFGTLAMFYTTYITLEQWATGTPDVPIDRCRVNVG